MQEFREPIRLVIWDLDETLWRGTLEEGEVAVPAEHGAIIESLARRGIVSSICSKNDHACAKARLEKDGLWEWFVFPRIEYAFKSDMIADIVEQIGLRPETVLFIDDNPFNRGEVEERVTGINVASEAIIAELLEHPQVRGKPDEQLSRLERYRVLETKQAEFAASPAPTEFLRECGIKLSVHFDVEDQFDRIHELVNRTNQLNFTKKRWSEGVDDALAEYLSRSAKTYGTHAGYVKVRDRYGYYGICGFFETEQNGNKLDHFLFSCRVLNMGVEQFVYQYLKYPRLKIVDKVVASLSRSADVDWIDVVADAEDEGCAPTQSDTVVCLHGPCELVQSAHYLRPYFRIVEEFQYPRDGWAIMRPLLRNFVLDRELKQEGIASVVDLGLPDDFPGIDFAALGSSLLSAETDICFWSFSLEPLISVYRHKATGIVFPISIGGFDQQDMTTLDFETVNQNAKLKQRHFEAFRDLFTYIALFDAETFERDLAQLRAVLEASRKPFVVIDLFDDIAKIDRPNYRKKAVLNARVRKALDGLPNVHHLSFSQCVLDRSEEIHLNHFSRSCYLRLAEKAKAQIALLEGAAV